MKIYFVLGIGLLLSSCSVNREVVGKYASQKNPNIFEFNSDSTFKYEFREFHLYQYATGRWKKTSQNTLVLNSTVSSATIPVKISKLDDVDLNRTKMTIDLRISDGMDLSNYKCKVFVNKTLFRITRCDSLKFIEIKSGIQQLSFQFTKEPIVITSNLISLPLSTEIISNPPSNFAVNLTFNDTLFSYRVFKDEVVKFRPNRIEIFNPHLKQWGHIYKVPDSSNIFLRLK
ncbi:hypothetical protein [Pedobacter sp. FW305-3-2-15-E-R2A2]|uniref:hypothetical protein n=1 Tax=Pedobacter sp. FW305-3-2-15-E-R2A2 TaxID=3140251 RepID=UPI00314053A8